LKYIHTGWPLSSHDQLPDFSLIFPDILKEHRWSIAPRNSSDMTSIGNNFNYFPENLLTKFSAV